MADPDSTARRIHTGMTLYGEFGLLSNSSFSAIRDKMNQEGIKPFESLMAAIVLAKRFEGERWFVENRLILMNSTNYTKDRDDTKGYFGGIGIGVMAGPKLLNTRKWNVLLPIGYDLMLYRMMVKNNQKASLGQIAQNASSYQPAKLYSANININAGLGVDYKIYLKEGFADRMYISTKANYHLALFRKGDWRGQDVRVSDLPAFKPDQLYWQIGLTIFPRKQQRPWHFH
ncbi:hypothetical protein CLV98_10362 [Dyadobacter jejuensis]|uniref:Outer membrane protein with beta-barrel domain n=2 Tax=Dyadobacter jejuensis TaxID=1082580 RepID=A0A316B7W6_9BACT|nr:hypothetical protein CLV98_10362 [Dyadobacter jejuensis]